MYCNADGYNGPLKKTGQIIVDGTPEQRTGYFYYIFLKTNWSFLRTNMELFTATHVDIHTKKKTDVGLCQLEQ